jgi:hypothetical protein
MIPNLYTFILFYFVISLSVIGYGLILFSLNKKFIISSNFGYAGLAGILVLCLYSYASSFFYKHGQNHNLIIILVGFLYFLYFNYLNFKNNRQNLSITVFFLIFYFIGICIYKTHDDFPYYHFQYSYYLTQSPSIVGLGNYDLGLRTPSSIFYLNSLFYLPVVKYFMFHMSVSIIFLYANIVLIFKLLKDNFYKKFNFLSFYYLFSFIFINCFFYRLAEHGTDRSAQILIFILIGEVLSFVNFKSEIQKNLSRLFLLIALIISLKAFYVLYIIFFTIIVFYLYSEFKFQETFIHLISNYYLFLFLFLFLFILVVNFSNTGCLIYPVSFTCFEQFSWSISKLEVDEVTRWYEQWSKAGANPNFRVENPEIYIQKFNWFSNWIDSYFFKKVSDFLSGLLFLLFFVIALFAPYKKIILNNKRKVLFTLSLIGILFFEWLYNHPSLRYGGYCLIASFAFLVTSLLIEKSKLSLEKIKKRILFLIILTLVVFFGRNMNRLFNEYKQYDYKPAQSIYYHIDDAHFNFQKTIDKLIGDFKNCTKFESSCVQDKTYKLKALSDKYILLGNK